MILTYKIASIQILTNVSKVTQKGNLILLKLIAFTISSNRRANKCSFQYKDTIKTHFIFSK